MVRETRPEVLMLWLGREDAKLAPAEEALGRVRQIVLSYSRLGEEEPEVPVGLKEKIRLTWRFAPPGHEEPLIYRVRAWMRARRIETTSGPHERLQLNTWFALAVADHSLTHVVENFSRDFFVESVEEETENSLIPGGLPFARPRPRAAVRVQGQLGRPADGRVSGRAGTGERLDRAVSGGESPEALKR